MKLSRNMLALLPAVALAGWLVPANIQAQAAKTVSPYASQIAALHATAQLLQQADHDYKGHRAKAVHEIHAAIHVLHPVAKKPHAPKAPGTAKAHNNEPQSVSDAQLAQAIVQLKAVSTQLAGAPALALADIQTAITELQTALTIK